MMINSLVLLAQELKQAEADVSKQQTLDFRNKGFLNLRDRIEVKMRVVKAKPRKRIRFSDEKLTAADWGKIFELNLETDDRRRLGKMRNQIGGVVSGYKLFPTPQRPLGWSIEVLFNEFRNRVNRIFKKSHLPYRLTCRHQKFYDDRSLRGRVVKIA